MRKLQMLKEISSAEAEENVMKRILNEESEMNTNSHASRKPSIDPDDKDNDKDNKINDEVKSEDVKTEIKDQLKGASIKPGTWNIPEHAGTSRNMNKIKVIFMKKKLIKKK